MDNISKSDIDKLINNINNLYNLDGQSHDYNSSRYKHKLLVEDIQINDFLLHLPKDVVNMIIEYLLDYINVSITNMCRSSFTNFYELVINIIFDENTNINICFLMRKYNPVIMINHKSKTLPYVHILDNSYDTLSYYKNANFFNALIPDLIHKKYLYYKNTDCTIDDNKYTFCINNTVTNINITYIINDYEKLMCLLNILKQIIHPIVKLFETHTIKKIDFLFV